MNKLNLQEKQQLLISEYKQLLNFYKFNYPVFHQSNIFFRDFHYAIKRYLLSKEIPISYKDADILVARVASFLEEQKIFIRVNDIGWRLDYPDFQTGITKPSELVA